MLATLTLAGCGGGSSGKGAVNVAYAGSLVNLMEHQVGPAFSQATGYSFQGRGAGSMALANQIKGKLITPDVFISASNGAYTPLRGDANGNLVRWHVSFAATAMVIGYSPKSQFKRQFDAAAAGTTPWYTVLRMP
ncbi:MAG: substrate-binding domain-containing protein, partial [Ktedonobacterales bacterium]|nr:substrate-binding domain-containing protein [Ktedonobacterales bacterium]